MLELTVGAVLGVLASLAVAIAIDRSTPEPRPAEPAPQMIVIEGPPPIIA